MNTENSIEIMKALSDESRLKIVNSLIEMPQYVEEIAQRIGLAASTVSFHLKKLEQAGLACKRKEQYYFIYSINPDLFDLSLRQLISPVHGNLHEQEVRIRKYRKKVMDTFIINGKLEKIPAQHKKRLIILEHLAMRFDAEKEYREEEMNSIIRNFHEDYCTLRRMLVDEEIFSRNGGKYRRKIPQKINLKHAEINKVISQRSTGKNMIDKKKIIRDYKSTHRPMGIFQIKNNLSGCIYLGSSKNLKSSENRHIFQLQQNGHVNSELQTEWNKLGASFFSFEIIDTLEPKEDMAYNYDDDLKTLFKLWKEKLTEEGKEVKLLVKHCKM